MSHQLSNARIEELFKEMAELTLPKCKQWIPPIEEGYSLLRVRGLVCYPDDVKAIEYAKSKQAEKCVQL
jgi:hypothetical protein